MTTFTIPEEATPLQLEAIAGFIEQATEHGHQPSDDCETCQEYVKNIVKTPDEVLRRRLLG